MNLPCVKYFSTISFCRKMTLILPSHSKYLFLIDHHCKTQSELINTIKKSQKWILFLQWVMGLMRKIACFGDSFYLTNYIFHYLGTNWTNLTVIMPCKSCNLLDGYTVSLCTMDLDWVSLLIKTGLTSERH